MKVKNADQLVNLLKSCKENQRVRFYEVNNTIGKVVNNSTLLGYIDRVDIDKNTIDTTGWVVSSLFYGIHKETGSLSDWIARGYNYEIVSM